MDDIKWKLLGIGVILTFLGQVSVWFQHNWQFVNPKYKPEWWGWYIIAYSNYLVFLKRNTIWCRKHLVVKYGQIDL